MADGDAAAGGAGAADGVVDGVAGGGNADGEVSLTAFMNAQLESFLRAILGLAGRRSCGRI